jgi:SOS response associated peptidase (SRAP)
MHNFFEWKAIKGGPKQPYAIALRSGHPFGIAGIWEGWTHPETGEVIRTFCIITCPANALVASIHDRMPVILPPEAYERWLANIEPDPRELLAPFPAEQMMMWPISTRVNKPDNDDPTILDPLEPVEGDHQMSCEQEVHPKPVRHNPEQHRFATDTPSGLVVADYRLEGNVMTIYHTEVPVPPNWRPPFSYACWLQCVPDAFSTTQSCCPRFIVPPAFDKEV